MNLVWFFYSHIERRITSITHHALINLIFIYLNKIIHDNQWNDKTINSVKFYINLIDEHLFLSINIVKKTMNSLQNKGGSCDFLAFQYF